jgi:glycosyltransferase involved in cell wall biosynthesis
MTPRLLMVSTFLKRYGTPGVCDELAGRLQAEGWRVRTTSSSPNRYMRVVDMLATVWRERGRFDVAQVDIFSGPAFTWAELVTLSLRRLGVPMVLTLHGGSLPAFSRRWPARVRRVLARADVVTVPSRYLQEQMRAHRADLRLLPNPIDVAMFRGEARRRVAPRLIWVRSMHQLYDPVTAVRVLASVAAMAPSATLTMVGPDKGDGSVAAVFAEAERLGVRDRLTWMGRLERAEVAKALAAHDIFLNTTGVDNTPLSVIEALAAGLVVVSTNVGGLPYLLTHERDALLVPFGDAAAMSDAVRRLLTDAALAASLAAAGQRLARRCDWTHILPEWQRLLSAVAQRRTAGYGADVPQTHESSI